MSWEVDYSAIAKSDLREIYEYIANELMAPDAAVSLMDRIMKEVRSLNELPFRYPLYEEGPWHSQGLRFFSVRNYMVFYRPEEQTHTVNIVRIMYGGRDIRSQLSGMNGQW